MVSNRLISTLMRSARASGAGQCECFFVFFKGECVGRRARHRGAVDSSQLRMQVRAGHKGEQKGGYSAGCMAGGLWMQVRRGWVEAGASLPLLRSSAGLGLNT